MYNIHVHVAVLHYNYQYYEKLGEREGLGMSLQKMHMNYMNYIVSMAVSSPVPGASFSTLHKESD